MMINDEALNNSSAAGVLQSTPLDCNDWAKYCFKNEKSLF